MESGGKTGRFVWNVTPRILVYTVVSQHVVGFYFSWLFSRISAGTRFNVHRVETSQVIFVCARNQLRNKSGSIVGLAIVSLIAPPINYYQ